MPLINLIESQIIFTRKAERTLQMSKLGLIGTATVLGSCYLVLVAQGASLGSQQAQIETQLKKIKPIQEQIDANKKEEANLSPRLTTLDSARVLTNRWARLMDHLSRNTPYSVWLTSFRASGPDPEKPIHITFNGVGKSQIDVSEMMMRTQNAEDLEAVALVGTQEKLFDKISGIEFEIAGDIIDTATKKRKPTEGQDKEEKA